MTGSETRRFCSSCGGDREITASFCEYCGKAFATGRVPDSAESRAWTEAQRYMVSGDLYSATRCLDNFEGEGGQSGDSLALRAMICLRSVQLDDARSLLDQALAMEPDSPFVHLKNAEYWLALGVTERAHEELLKARMLSVGDEVLWAQVSKVLQTFDVKTRWAFSRGHDDDLLEPEYATTVPQPNVPNTKGANAWQS